MTEHNWDDNGVCQNHGAHCSMAADGTNESGDLPAWQARNYERFVEALVGVELTEEQRFILRWLAQREAATVEAVAGLFERSWAAGCKAAIVKYEKSPTKEGRRDA